MNSFTSVFLRTFTTEKGQLFCRNISLWLLPLQTETQKKTSNSAQLTSKAVNFNLEQRSQITLTISTGKNCVLLSSLQGLAGWLFLIFFICLHNQLSFIHSIITYEEYRCLKNVIFQIGSKSEI